MSNLLPSVEAATYHTILEDLKASQDAPKRAGSFVVAATLDQTFANKAEDGLRNTFGAFATVDCIPRESGFTEVRYSVDEAYTQPEQSPQESDIIIDPTIEAAS